MNMLILDFDLLGRFWRENGLGHHTGGLLRNRRIVPQNPTKNFAHWVNFGLTVITKK